MEQLRVILADDHPFVLLGVGSALSMHQDILIVGEATSPASLIHLLQTVACDVLVTDLTMPVAGAAVEDGVRLVRRIRFGWPAIPVVVLTSLTNAAVLRAVISDDAVSMLNKTDSLDELATAVRRARVGCPLVSRSILDALAEAGGESADMPAMRTLSPKESEVIGMFVRGQSISEIARLLGRDVRAVSRLKRVAMAKLGVSNDLGLFAHAKVTEISEN
jgi:two-component system, NarL family, captular synthesis response regulator RcsB